MILKDAIDELEKGNKITRLAWNNEFYLHYASVDGQIVITAFRKEFTPFSNIHDATELLSSEKKWLIVEGDNNLLSFSEALEELKKGHKIKYETWKTNYLKLNNNRKEIVKFNTRDFDFTLTDNDLLANDWIVPKDEV